MIVQERFSTKAFPTDVKLHALAGLGVVMSKGSIQYLKV